MNNGTKERLIRELRQFADSNGSDKELAEWMRANAGELADGFEDEINEADEARGTIIGLEGELEERRQAPEIQRLQDRLHADPGSTVRHDPDTAMLIFRPSGWYTNPVPVIASSLQELGARA